MYWTLTLQVKIKQLSVTKKKTNAPTIIGMIKPSVYQCNVSHNFVRTQVYTVLYNAVY